MKEYKVIDGIVIAKKSIGFSTTDITEIEKVIINNENLYEIYKRIGFTNLIRIMFIKYSDQTIRYLQLRAKELTLDRMTISLISFYFKIFGENYKKVKIHDDIATYNQKIIEIVNNEYENQKIEFLRTNMQELSLNNTVWKLYWLRGVCLNSREFNFEKIKSPTLRKEMMTYTKNKILNRKDYRSNADFSNLNTCLNFLSDNNLKIKYCRDITLKDVERLLNYLEYSHKTQYNKKLAVKSLIGYFSACRGFVDFFIKIDEHPCHFPLPTQNPFNSIKFKGAKWHSCNTLPIPEIVINQTNNFVQELSKQMHVVYMLLKSTGMRIGDIIKLEADCVEYNKEYCVWTIQFIPHKNSKQRKRNNLSKYHLLVIPENVAKSVLEVEADSLEYRLKYDSNYIFLKAYGNGTTKLMGTQSICSALNKLVKKHNIVDDDGSLWNFTSRQYRKTVAVTMIENGASLQEIGSQLAHIGDSSTKDYYAEVRKMKLAELNHSFFQKKFNVIMTEEKLSNFTEEQRKKLYVDFCISEREVEFGKCLKTFSADTCSKIKCQSDCSTCSNLCTGSKYLEKWEQLLSSQTKIAEELLKFYKEKNITDYQEFKEYQRESYLLLAYTEVVKNIKEKSRLYIYGK